MLFRSGSDVENNEGSTENGTNNVVPDDAPAVLLDEASEVMNDEEKPKRRRRTRGGSKAKVAVSENDSAVEVIAPLAIVTSETVADTSLEAFTETVTPAEISTEKPKRVRKPRKTKAQREAEEAAFAFNESMTEVPIEAIASAALEALESVAKPKTKRVRKSAAVAVEAINKTIVAEIPSTAPVVAEPTVDAVAVVKDKPEPEPNQPVVPKKRGWWSRG